jgi:hypothetical protein
MKSPNKAPKYKSLRAVAAVSAFALAATGIGAAEASATPNQSQRSAISAEGIPLVSLARVISSLDKGGAAQVSAEPIDIPGPIGDAQGEPIVFKAGGHNYLAYTQEHEPNFSNAPLEVARTMNIVEEPASDVDMPLTEAHLDKTGILVNEDEAAVGFSTGDNAGK